MTQQTIGGVTSTVCSLLGIECADQSLESPFAVVLEKPRTLGIDRCERAFLYAPDAIGRHLCAAFPDVIGPVVEWAPTVVQVTSVVPPVTPVCFSTMFTGQPPSVHGIRRYERPVLECQTLFDRLIGAGKRVAIVAVHDSSIDRIFRDRALDYCSEMYDPQVTAKTLSLLEADGHDVVLAYHREYDDTLHRTTPQAAEAIGAMQRYVASFVELARAVDRCWGRYDRLLGFVPDHGGHVDPDTGKGTHGLDTPEDMDVQHFYGVFRGAAEPRAGAVGAAAIMSAAAQRERYADSPKPGALLPKRTSTAIVFTFSRFSVSMRAWTTITRSAAQSV